jgi:hypothetical protein
MAFKPPIFDGADFSRRLSALAVAVASWSAPLGAAALIIYVVAVTAVSWVAPAANWDMIAYVAVLLEAASKDSSALHAAAYQAVRTAVTPGEFLVLAGDRPYRVAQYADASALASMLGFYRVKFLYTEVAIWLAQYLDPVSALRLVSTLSCLAIGVIALWWSVVARILHLAPLVIALLILGHLGATARLVTPDLFAGIFVILGILLFVRGKDWIAALLLVLAVLARPDHLPLLLCILVVGLAIRRGWLPMAIATIVALTATLIVQRVSGHPGWWVHMWFNFVEPVPNIVGFDPPFSLKVYLSIVAEALVRSLIDENWLALAIVQAGLALALCKAGWRPGPRTTAALVAILFCELGKMIATPFDETRYHFSYLVASGLILIQGLSASPWSDPSSPSSSTAGPQYR